jgi:hypothetical protein
VVHVHDIHRFVALKPSALKSGKRFEALPLVDICLDGENGGGGGGGGTPQPKGGGGGVRVGAVVAADDNGANKTSTTIRSGGTAITFRRCVSGSSSFSGEMPLVEIVVSASPKNTSLVADGFVCKEHDLNRRGYPPRLVGGGGRYIPFSLSDRLYISFSLSYRDMSFLPFLPVSFLLSFVPAHFFLPFLPVSFFLSFVTGTFLSIFPTAAPTCGFGGRGISTKRTRTPSRSCCSRWASGTTRTTPRSGRRRRASLRAC